MVRKDEQIESLGKRLVAAENKVARLAEHVAKLEKANRAGVAVQEARPEQPAHKYPQRFVSSQELQPIPLLDEEEERNRPGATSAADKTIRQVAKNDCSGCGACLNACPKNAIRMVLDSEGFLYPEVANECVNCGLCLQACPAAHPKPLHPTPRAYAVWASDDTRLKSSSGGMFSLLAEETLRQGGAVCGAVYSADFQTVHHAWAETEAQLGALRGSKYVQSDTGETYRRAKELLEKGRKVLYTGCPCQIAGLYGFLGKDYPNLLTADLVCHGSNSTTAYQSFLKEFTGGREKDIEKVDFRDKKYYTWSTPTVVYFKDGGVKKVSWDKGTWYTGFLGGVVNRMNCYRCPYARAERVADLSLGDAWQVQRILPALDDRKGTSLVLVNSEKGREVFEALRAPRKGLFGTRPPAMKLCEEIPLEEIRRYNGQLNNPTPMSRNRRFFFSHLGKLGYHRALWYGRGRRWDVGLVGWCFSSNHGSALTYYALGRILEDMGKSVIFIPVSKPNKTPWEPEVRYSVDFLSKYFKIAKERPFNRMGEYNAFCDSFMLGSDQLWVPTYTKLLGYSFYLDFVEPNKKKIAFSTSLGHDRFEAPPEQIATIHDYLSRFDGISVREYTGVDICRNVFGVEAQQVFDPVFMCSRERYDVIADRTSAPDRKYLLCYILDPAPEKEEAAKHIAQHEGLEILVVFGIREYAAASQKWHTGKIMPNITTDKFLSLVKHCSYLLTDSHHGTCFGIIYQRKYAALLNASRGRTRFKTVAQGLGLTDRLFESAGDILKDDRAFAPIDYGAVEKRLAEQVDSAKKWLERAFAAEPKQNAETERTVMAAARRLRFEA